MRELTVVEVRVSTSGTAPVVVLQEVGGDRLLPIWTSAGGAAAIVAATEEPDTDRPAIHDLVGDLLAALGGGLDEVRIVAYAEGQFHAEVVVDGTELSCRPSDAIALALRAGRPIKCADEVLEEAGVSATPAAPEAPEEEVEKFREFLDSVNPDDF